MPEIKDAEFENYVTVCEIPPSGMGIVYRAVDSRTGTAVAIKELAMDAGVTRRSAGPVKRASSERHGF